MERAKKFMDKKIKLKYRVKGTLQYIIYSKFANIKIDEKSLLIFLLYPIGICIYKNWKNKYINQEK